jgi:hypothetical protein
MQALIIVFAWALLLLPATSNPGDPPAPAAAASSARFCAQSATQVARLRSRYQTLVASKRAAIRTAYEAPAQDRARALARVRAIQQRIDAIDGQMLGLHNAMQSAGCFQTGRVPPTHPNQRYRPGNANLRTAPLPMRCAPGYHAVWMQKRDGRMGYVCRPNGGR